MTGGRPAQLPRFRIVEENLRATMRQFARARRNGETVDLPGVTVVFAGVDLSVFNAALLDGPVRDKNDLVERIGLASLFFGSKRAPWSFWVCEDFLDEKLRYEAPELFRRHGLGLSSISPGMIAEKLHRPPRPLMQLDIRPVGDRTTRLGFCRVMAAAFHGPMPLLSEVYGSESFWKSDFRGWVGYVDDKPVSTAAIVVAAGAIGVYAVATLPERQRRGWAESVMRYAVETARSESGYERTILQSSEAGLSLYRRMGYETVTSFSLYAV